MRHPPHGIRSGVRRLFRLALHRPSFAPDDADLELRAFIDARIEHLVSRGMTPDEARAEAMRRLGTSVEDARHLLQRSAAQREIRMSIFERAADLLHDLKYAARGLRARPGFTAAVVITLGLGIGANASMFGIVDRLLFRSPAYMTDATNVHRIYFARTFDGTESITANIQYRRYRELREWTRSFDRSAAFFGNDMPVGEGRDARQRYVIGASASFFSFFDARPARGRFFTAIEDSIPAGIPVAVLGYDFWRSNYQGSDDVLGKTIRIGSLPFTIIGVAPRGFTGVDLRAPIAFVPITAMGTMFSGDRDPKMYYRTYNMSWMEMIGHRRTGVSVTAATTDMTTAFRRSYMAQRELQPRTLPIELVKPRAIVASVLQERGPNQRGDSKVAAWLIGVTAIVLLVACANVANLLLARAFSRRREIAVRLALGMSRGRLVLQLGSESFLLALFGGVFGLAVAQIGGSVMRSLFLPGAAGIATAVTDRRTLLFTSVAVVVAALLAAFAPIVHARRGDLTDSLKAGVREGTYHRSRTRAALMVAQGALSVLLLVGAGLFVRSLRNANDVRLGFEPERLLFVQTDMRSTEMPAAQQATLMNRLLERAKALPEVASAARGVTVPFWSTMNLSLYVPGIDSVSRFGEFDLQAGSPEYFVTVGTRLLRGRGIEPTDVATSPFVIVVSDRMAKTLWPNEEAIGKCVKLNADTLPCHTVVGISEEIKSSSLAGDERVFHYVVPIEQFVRRGGLYIRTRGDVRTQSETIRRELQSLMPGDSYLEVRPMSEILAPLLRSWRLGATLFVAFGALALILATIGLYSVIAYNVVQRTHELGVRVALGAQGGDVLRLVLSQGMRLAVTGILLGGLAAFWAAKLVKPLLFQVSPRDPLVFALVSAALLGAALLASVIPSWRATRVHPITALRSD